MNNPQGVSAYQSVGASGAIGGASRERLVQMLLDGALERIATAKGHILRGEAAQKGEQIGKAISIVEGLRVSLNPEAGEISQNLDDLYTYIGGRLLTANTSEDPGILDEVGDLLREIKSAWDVILASQTAGQDAASA